MSMDRYLANVAALGDTIARRLQQTCVGVVGNTPVAQAVMYNLIGLGVGSIEHVTTSDALRPGILKDLATCLQPGCDSIDDALFRIAPQINYVQVGAPTRADIVLDTKTCSVLDSHTKHVAQSDATFSDDTYGDAYHTVSDLVTGALLADEVRKHAGFVSKYEQKLSAGQSVFFSPVTVLHAQAISLRPYEIKNALVIGAGGIGTYCTYVLAKRGVSHITICDPDVVNETNLNRQLFYTGCVREPKATVLPRRLSSQICKITPRKESFTRNFSTSALFDAVFCCTDTLESRIAADAYATSHGIPLVEGACTPTMGSVTTYLPGKTKSVSVQRNLPELLRLQSSTKPIVDVRESQSCAKTANPSVIGPNVIVGALQAIALDDKFDSSGNLLSSYPQLYLNLLRNSKFSLGSDGGA